MTDQPPTNQPVPAVDLFARVEAYYREHFTRAGRGEDFDRWLSGAHQRLHDAANVGAEPAFLLHVLACTAGRGIRRYADDRPSIRRLSPSHRAQLVGVLNFLRNRGEPWLLEVFGPRETERAKTFYTGAVMFHSLLVGGAVTTPAWESAFVRPPQARDQKNMLTGCILCLHEALHHAPKPIARIVVLLDKFGLLTAPRSVRTRAKLVEQRVRRNQALAADRLGPVGSVVSQLKRSFENLKEFLDSPPGR
jgi:hypothetical protein